MSHAAELHFEFCNLLLCLKQVLRVKVTIRSHCLIEVLLLFQASFGLDVLLLKLSDQVVLELHLLKALIVLGIGLGCLYTILLLVLLKLIDQLLQLLGFCLITLDLVLELL